MYILQVTYTNHVIDHFHIESLKDADLSHHIYGKILDANNIQYYINHNNIVRISIKEIVDIKEND